MPLQVHHQLLFLIFCIFLIHLQLDIGYDRLKLKEADKGILNFVEVLGLKHDPLDD